MTLASLRFALGAAGALIATAAFAQTQPAPAAPPPPAPPAPPASPYPPTATLGSGYPGAGPADTKLQAISLPNGKKMHLLPATLETTRWGWLDNAQPPA